MPVERPHLQISYTDVLAVARLMQDFPAPWYVSGGWAIDALLGQATRVHEDLEIGIARTDQRHLHRYLAGWQFYKLVPWPDDTDADLVPWTPNEQLELPIFQIVVRRAGAQPPEFEFFLNEMGEDTWQFRKEPSIRYPLAASYRWTAQGIPALAPELQLLHKANKHQPKDEHDFRTALPYLTPAQRTWLRRALERYQPGDPWLAALANDP